MDSSANTCRCPIRRRSRSTTRRRIYPTASRWRSPSLCGSPRTAHRATGYFEEEAVRSYTEYLEGVDRGTHENVPAPRIAIDYWKLAPDARLRDVIVAVRADEAGHRDVNHRFADELA